MSALDLWQRANELAGLRLDGVDRVVFRRQDLPAQPKFVLDESKRITIV